MVLYNEPIGKDMACLSDYALALAQQLPNYKITYRFHPGLKKNEQVAKKLTVLNKLDNLRIDTNIDIYTSLNENEYLVCENSTVIYEATCLGKKVLVLRTEADHSSIDPDMVVMFSSPNELVEKVRNGSVKNISNETKEAIFSSNFKENYLRFLSDIGI